MTEKLYRVQMNSKGMPNFATAVEIEDIPIYGNEHNCMMTIFGACSYAETGCGDCAVVEKVRRALSADRPQGEWKHLKGDEWLCSNCGYVVWTVGSWEHPLERGKDYCEHCGCRMKGADNA